MAPGLYCATKRTQNLKGFPGLWLRLPGSRRPAPPGCRPKAALRRCCRPPTLQGPAAARGGARRAEPPHHRHDPGRPQPAPSAAPAPLCPSTPARLGSPLRAGVQRRPSPAQPRGRVRATTGELDAPRVTLGRGGPSTSRPAILSSWSQSPGAALRVPRRGWSKGLAPGKLPRRCPSWGGRGAQSSAVPAAPQTDPTTDRPRTAPPRPGPSPAVPQPRILPPGVPGPRRRSPSIRAPGAPARFSRLRLQLRLPRPRAERGPPGAAGVAGAGTARGPGHPGGGCQWPAGSAQYALATPPLPPLAPRPPRSAPAARLAAPGRPGAGGGAGRMPPRRPSDRSAPAPRRSPLLRRSVGESVPPLSHPHGRRRARLPPRTHREAEAPSGGLRLPGCPDHAAGPSCCPGRSRRHPQRRLRASWGRPRPRALGAGEPRGPGTGMDSEILELEVGAPGRPSGRNPPLR